jgi:capsular polysaccharide biosynthesis protein
LETAYPGLRTVELAQDVKVPVEEALWLSMQAGNAEWNVADAAPVHRMAEIFREHYGLRAGHGRRLFFSRGGSKIRRLVNEDVLFEIAKEHGFERFEARADNHAEQVRAFSDADIVVGVHGAGLGNLAFCKPGTRMLEIFPENFTKSTYLWVSRHIGLEYDWMVGGPGDYDQAFSLDETRFRRKLDELLAGASA